MVGNQEDKDQRADEQHEGVEQARNNLECRYCIACACGRCNGDEHLCAIGDDALENARERIEDRCGLAARDIVGFRHVRRDGICHNNRHGVVRGCDIHASNQDAHAELAAFAVLERVLDGVEQPYEAAIFANERADGGDQNGDHRCFEHARCAGAHARKQIGCGGGSRCDHDNGAGKNAQKQNDENVDANNAARQNYQVRDELDKFVFMNHCARDVRVERQHQNNHERCQCGRQRNLKVLAELVFHCASLTLARRDCRVRDERQVVAKHRATHNRRHAERQIEAGGSGHGNGNGRDERNGAHRGSHGERNEAAHDKQNGHRKLRWNERKHEVRDAFGAVAAYGAYEYTGCHEDEDHGDDCLVANAAPHNGQLVIETELAILEACH